MTKRSEFSMKEVIKRAKKELPPASFSGPSSLDDGMAREIGEIEELLALLPVYREASPALTKMHRKMTNRPGWVPSPADRQLFFATVREVRRRATAKGSVADLIEFETDLDLPSALDPASFDLVED